jgi:hypothetical protein
MGLFATAPSREGHPPASSVLILKIQKRDSLRNEGNYVLSYVPSDFSAKNDA